MEPSVTFVILAGGKGERLWPLARAAIPKVCLPFDKTRSLLQATIDRLRSIWRGARWLIVTTQEQADAVRAHVPLPLRSAIVVEPHGKNTAACIALAAAVVATRSPHEVMVVTPADHWIGSVSAFQRTVRAAIHAAVAHETIATIGIRPTHPHPGLGYLCAGPLLDSRKAPRIFRLARLIEKPSLAITTRLIRQSAAYWNSGVFVGTAGRFLESLTERLPEHVRRLVPLAQKVGTRSFPRHAKAAYRTLLAVSFDTGVMVHLSGGVIVEGLYPWADLGSWNSWVHVNRSDSPVMSVESRNVTVVNAEQHLVATIGVRDLLVVHTPSATLICRPERAQAVRKIVTKLSTTPQLSSYR